MGNYQSAHTGAELDASVLLSQNNKDSITDIEAVIAAPRKITGILTVDVAINATFAAGIAQTFTASLSGAAIGDVCIPYSGIAGGYAAQTIGGANPLVISGCWVSSADTVSVRVHVPITSGVAYNFTMKVLVLQLNLS